MRRNRTLDDPALTERYTLDGVLGEGGFGTVYRATQKATGQAVAIKVIKAARNMGKRLARFARETRICAEMHHPHIVRLIDAHQSPTAAWSVFELVPGRDLAAVLVDEGRLTPAETIRLMGQVLDALAAAHTQGIAHRDIKPANVMVVGTGARRNAMVLDFGIGALIEERQELDLTRITATREPLGTPAYAAPEQLRGLPPTVRSDLYAWALTFLECLTGQRAITGNNVAHILVQQVGPKPVELPLEISDHPLGRLLGRALVKDPVARDVTAEGLLAELEAIDIDSLELVFAPVRRSADAPTPASVIPTVTGTGALEVEDDTRPMTSPPTHQTGTSTLRPLSGERRPVTLVACALEPVAPIAPDAVEEADAVLRAELAVITETARRFGGQLAAAHGDSALLVFGHPVVTEDDPVRAARAALALVAENSERAELRAGDARAAVRMAVGLHSGPVIMRPGASVTEPGFMVGHTARIADALARQGLAGTIRVSSQARQRLVKRFAFDDHGEARAVGGAPVRIFSLVGESSGAGASTRDVMIGRAAELSRLVDAWSHAEAGRGRAVLISGEAGIGKSRLVGALSDAIVARAHRWLDLRCAATAVHAALRPVIELLRRLSGTTDRSVGAREAFGAFIDRLGLNRDAAQPLIGPLMGLPADSALDVSPARRRQMTLEMLVEILCRLSESEPVVLAVEDLHWADATTLALLEQLTARLPTTRMLLLVTARPEGAGLLTASTQIDVGRLDRDGVGALAARVAGVARLHDAVIDRIAERTDGVPLFVEEVVRSMLDAKVLVSAEGGHRLSDAGDTFDIPESLEALLAARLNRLGPARTIAQLAAAVGRTVDQDLLEAIHPQGAFAARDALGQLERSGLVHRSWRLEGTRWSFHHALVRDAAYRSMPRSDRMAVHHRIATALIEQFTARAEARPDLVARHLAAAGEAEAAMPWALRAAGGALGRSDNVEAIGHADEALGWLGDIADPQARARAELDLNGLICPALMASSGWTDPRIKQVADRSLALLAELPDGPHLQRTIWTLMTYAHLSGTQRQTSLGLARRLVDLAEQSEDPGARVAADCAVGNCLWIDGDYAGAVEHLDAVFARYSTERDGHHGLIYGQDTRVWAACAYNTMTYARGHHRQSFDATEANVAYARELKHASSEALALLFAANVCQLDGDRAGVRRWCGELMTLADRYGLPGHAAYAGVFSGWAEGNPALAEQCVQGLLYVGSALGITYYIAVLAQTLFETGQTEAAWTHLRDALQRADAMGETYFLATIHRLSAQVAAHRGAEAAVIEHHRQQAEALAGRQGLPMVRLDTALDALERSPGAVEARARVDAAWAVCPDPGPARRARWQSLTR